MPYTTMSGNARTVWVLILVSTDRYISVQGGIVDAVLTTCVRNLKQKTSCLLHVVCPLLPASVTARMHGDEATADGIGVCCWCCWGLWLFARTHNPPLGTGVYVDGQATPAVTFYPLTVTAQAPTNKRN